MSDGRYLSAEQEWADQERALREERLGLASTRVEPRLAEYRLITRILREPVEPELPLDFAASVAARVEPAREADDGVVLWLQRVLLAMLVGTGAVFLAGDPASWLQRWANEARAMPAGQWALAIGVCLAVTLLLERWTWSTKPRHTRLEGG